MNRKHRKTLEKLFELPSSLPWKDIESLLIALGAEITERKGSRIGITLNNIRIVMHRPHPSKEAGQGRIKAVRDFLRNAGVKL